MINFDVRVERRGSGSFKWDDNDRQFGRGDVLPFWVADMDFATPAPILAALRDRCAHPVLGYELRASEYYDAVIDWLATRHRWQVPRDWLMFCPPGSIVGIHAIVSLFSEAGDSVVVPAPNYGPLTSLVENTGRHVLSVPMRETAATFSLALNDIDTTIDANTRLVINSSPHNPTGRVFTKDELTELAGLAEKHDLIVISDEVHADLVLPGNQHIPYGSIGGDRSVTGISPNKTFNTAGIPQATLIIPAIGQKPDLGCLYDDGEGECPLVTTRWQTIVADPDTFQTAIPGVFTAGDVYTGPDLVISAIGDGRKAARSIHYFMTQDHIPVPETTQKGMIPYTLFKEIDQLERKNRAVLPHLCHGDERNCTFNEVEGSLSEAEAQAEADRCLRCGLVSHDRDAAAPADRPENANT